MLIGSGLMDHSPRVAAIKLGVGIACLLVTVYFVWRVRRQWLGPASGNHPTGEQQP